MSGRFNLTCSRRDTHGTNTACAKIDRSDYEPWKIQVDVVCGLVN